MMRSLADLKIESDVLESNPISIKSVRSATINEWDIIWRDCNYSTFFHSVEWAEIWSKYMRGKMTLAPSLVLFSDGKKALLPFSCLRRNGLVQKTIRLHPCQRIPSIPAFCRCQLRSYCFL